MVQDHGETSSPEYAPGEVMAYHPRNFGWIIGELVRRIDGRPFNHFLRDEITAPLGMKDAYVGLPPELEPGCRGYTPWRTATGRCPFPPTTSPPSHQAVHPAGGGITTARDLARFYAMLGNGGELDGVRILEEDTVRRGHRVYR